MRSFDPSPHTVLRAACLLVLGMGLLAGVVRWRSGGPAENPAYDALSKAHTRRMAADSVALDSARRELAKAQAKTLKAVASIKVLRDTLNIHDTVQVKVFVERADSVVRSCSELSDACERFRVRSDSLVASLRLSQEVLRKQVASLTPSKPRRFLAASWPVVAFVGGVWIGAKVTR